MQQSHTLLADFDDYYRVLRENVNSLHHDALIKPLSGLWLSSFRFLESGWLEDGQMASLSRLAILLEGLRSKMAMKYDPRIERIVAHLTDFAHKVERLQLHKKERFIPQAPSFIGSAWDITWENLVISPSKQSLDIYYKESTSKPFHLTATEDGFVSEDGYRGHWEWKQYPGGRLALHIGGEYPVGWGWYKNEGQREINIHFYISAYARAFERIRWVRSS